MQLDFYTNVSRLGNNIIIRGIRNGKEVRFKESYEPTLYLQNDKADYGFKTLYGENLKPIRFNSMYDLKEFTDETGRYDTPKLNLQSKGIKKEKNRFTYQDIMKKRESNPEYATGKKYKKQKGARQKYAKKK